MSPPRIAYQKLKEHLEAMKVARHLDDLALAWELFLIYHQRTWNKFQPYYNGKGYWNSLKNKYRYIRDTNPVLIYVHQARHVDEHGIEPITEEQEASTVISAGKLTAGTTVIGGGDYTVGPGSTATIEVNPATVRSNPVINRNTPFDPPVLNGDPRPPVLHIAQEAIKFFDELFAEIDAAGGD